MPYCVDYSSQSNQVTGKPSLTVVWFTMNTKSTILRPKCIDYEFYLLNYEYNGFAESEVAE